MPASIALLYSKVSGTDGNVEDIAVNVHAIFLKQPHMPVKRFQAPVQVGLDLKAAAQFKHGPPGLPGIGALVVVDRLLDKADLFDMPVVCHVELDILTPGEG